MKTSFYPSNLEIVLVEEDCVTAHRVGEGFVTKRVIKSSGFWW
jgi:hypothetical protein